ncbi:hypothetical protein B0T26DRAFT_675480 [Lasiosphaeria miniovina]|uniref:CFEM domain-containing protein n=1 Tax=Lasiosphaeria miniovina TaxID=1954250 RepID=A0AA40AJS1_9PEZI|nr:uncharacterized protein B0T26DRAFT_675480 [Lasiosphaeria miniovina]KAK0717118.1 hypothetical protein B0T26DRAFT_675480 [Lasiosphaeria miniovina]
MKNVVSILALASSVVATGFNKAPPFSCPSNTDNKCTDKQKPGFNFGDLNIGPVFQYNDFTFKNFQCGASSGKRFEPRTSSKFIGGTCHSDKASSPSFGCGASVDKFSLGSIHVKPEFDCDLEFHYDMPDGSTCKHRNPCSKSGTTVVNSQCGGAKNVTIVYPPQPNKPKPSCSVQVPTVSFDCSTASSTKPATTKPATTTAPGTTTPGTTAPGTTAPGTTSTTAPSTTAPSTTAPGTTSTTAAGTTSTAPVGVSSNSPVTASSSAPAVVSSSSTVTTTFVTQSTSTVFTTSTQTITSCAPTIPNCPANSVVTTVVTVAVSTTVCPVTLTQTSVLTTSSAPVVVDTTSSAPVVVGTTSSAPVVVGTTSSAPVVVGTTSSAPVDVGTTSVAPVGGTTSSASVDVGTTSTTVIGTTSAATSVAPVETLPCPDVVPSCLSTFMFSVGCSDNSDSRCYCPDEIFVKNIFNCIYAHGATDQIVSEAVIFFQGICAQYVPTNPAIATGATVTTYITVSATPTAVAPVYTTITVDQTVVVPCTDSAGVTIPSSSTTVTISTTLSVPQVGFSTGTAGSVGLIPVTTPPAVASSVPGLVTAPATGVITAGPVGTGSFRPSATQPGFVTAGSGRVNAGLSLALGMTLLAILGL